MAADTEIVIDDNDLAELRKAAPRKAGGDTVKSRLRAEKPMAKFDGRKQRPSKSQAEVPLNVDVAPEIKALVLKARAEFGLPMKAFVAQAIERHFRELEIEMQSGE